MWSFGNTRRCGLATSCRWFGSIPVLLATLMSGCGGGTPKKAAQVEETAPKVATKTERPAEQAEKPAASKKNAKSSGIPMDAYFDNPLEVAANSATVAAPTNPGNEPPATPDKPKGDMPKPEATGGGGALVWSEYLPVENLQSEMKRVQNRLKGWLQGQGTYNGNYKDIAVDGAVIAALAGIAIEHSGDVPWKANAPIIRDLGYELSQAATGLGKDNYEKSKAAFEKLEAVFSGTIPADAPKSAPKRPFHETADRTGLMKRIEKASNHLRDNINTEGKLKGEAESVLHETLMISTLGKIVATEGYSSADEADYQQFAEALINGAREATSASKDLSFPKFGDAMNKVNKSCAQCHANYGNG